VNRANDFFKRSPAIVRVALFARCAVIFVLFFVTILTARSGCINEPMMQGQDPSVGVIGSNFYLVQSDGCNIHLRQAGSLAGLPSASNPSIYRPGCSNIWAPEIHWFNNHCYIYYSSDTGGTGEERVHVIESQTLSPTGPFTDRGVLFTNYWNIDGTVFTNYDGKFYFVCSGSPGSGQNLYIAPMSNPYTLSGSLTLISQPTQSWERNGIVNEGPFAFLRNGKVFLVYSASGCWTDDYCLGLLTLTGTNLLSASSWTKSGPMFTKKDGAYGPGHNCVLQDLSGQWWNVYHANNLTNEGCGGKRQIRAQRISWNASNVPDFGSPVPVNSLVTEDTNFLAVNFPLNQTSGGLAAYSGCGVSGLLVGSPVWTKPGLRFNGVNDYVDCGSRIGNDVQHALTLAAWIRADAFNDWGGIISKGTNASPYALQVWHNGSVRFTANFNAPPGAIGSGSWNSAGKMATGQWYHIAVTYDGVNVRFYINAKLDSYQPPATLRFGVVNEPLSIGADFPGGDEFFAGTIRDVRIYGRALNLAEIRNISGFDQPPHFTSPAITRFTGAGQILTVANTATEAASPPQTLTFNLLAGPNDSTLDPTNGIFTWRPAVAYANSTNLVSLEVFDTGSPSLSATQNFFVVVTNLSAPTLDQFSYNSGIFQMRVNGDFGPDYILQTTTNLRPPISWNPIFTNFSPAPPFFISDTNPSSGGRFYKITLAP
jgi:GH43 family beta-xylosidase